MRYLLAILVALLLAGCSGAATPGPTETAAPTAAATVAPTTAATPATTATTAATAAPSPTPIPSPSPAPTPATTWPTQWQTAYCGIREATRVEAVLAARTLLAEAPTWAPGAEAMAAWAPVLAALDDQGKAKASGDASAVTDAALAVLTAETDASDAYQRLYKATGFACPGDETWLSATPAPATPTPAVTTPPTYAKVTDRAWKQIVKSPDKYAGEAYQVWACITQFDAATGDNQFRGEASNRKLDYWYSDGDNAMFVGEPSRLADFVEGDVVFVDVVASGSLSYDTQAGGSTTVPQFEVRQISRRGSCE